MKTLLLSLFTILSLTIQAQECILLEAPKMMGLEVGRAELDLEDIDPVTLPVVFHVVHTGGEENISDEQLLSQIDVMNIEFADSKIQFCLAARTPEGDPTTGITRYDASWNEDYVEAGCSSSSNEEGWNETAMKAEVGCWNPDQYLNIYSVSEINGNDGSYGTQGFAYLGATGDCRDGIVCLHNALGNEGVLKPYTQLGLTAVHEVGHYLNLYHTFSGSCSETNCSTQGDRVCDTPPTTPNFSCTETECPDALLENFMDYTPETCRESFTEGQAVRMHQCIQSQRQGLLTALSCEPVVDYDATASYALYQEEWCASYQDIWVTIVNQGSLTLPSIDVSLFCNGVEYTKVVEDLPGGQSEDVSFLDVYVEAAQMFEVQVSTPLDQNEDNDYAYWPIDFNMGNLVKVIVDSDVYANYISWTITDEDGELVAGDQDYPFGEETYEYNVCVYDGCYDVVIEDVMGNGFCQFDWNDDGDCDYGEGSFLAVTNDDTLVWTGEGAIFDVYQATFCNTITTCELDYDGNGTIGNGDILVMLSYFGCDFACPYDPNQDGAVTVMDLLFMLTNVGACEVEMDFSPATYFDYIIETEGQLLPTGKPRIYDMLGRRVDTPFDQLSRGVYIMRWKNVVRKVFVQ